jgi:hypothetical protein
MDRMYVCNRTTKIKQKYCRRRRPMFSSSTFTVNICLLCLPFRHKSDSVFAIIIVVYERRKKFVLNLDVIRERVEDKRLRHERMTGVREV